MECVLTIGAEGEGTSEATLDTMSSRVEAYLASRRQSGFALRIEEEKLARFVDATHYSGSVNGEAGHAVGFRFAPAQAAYRGTAHRGVAKLRPILSTHDERTLVVDCCRSLGADLHGSSALCSFFFVANLIPPESTGQDRRKSRHALMPVSRRARSHLSCLRQRSGRMSGLQHVRTVTIPLTIRLFSREKRTCQTVARRLLYTQYTVALKPDL